MLYTRKGDDGTTKTLNAKERISKGCNTIDALGNIDEINSFIGLCKIKAKELNLNLEDILFEIQNNLFIIQAELAGSNKTITIEKINTLEQTIDNLEKQIPPIKNFILSGGSEISALFDIARTISRRAERSIIIAIEKENLEISNNTKCYINRLSSALYALARFSNFKLNIEEVNPRY